MQTLTYVSRRLRIYGRPKRGFVQPLVFFAWKKVLGGAAPRKPWNRFFRPKHQLGYLPPQAPANSAFQGGRTVYLYYTSRRIRLAEIRLRRTQYPPAPPPAPVVTTEVHNRYFFADVGSLMSR